MPTNDRAAIVWDALLPIDGLGGVVTPLTYSVVRRGAGVLLENWQRNGGASAAVGAELHATDGVLGLLRGRLFLNQGVVMDWIAQSVGDAALRRLVVRGLSLPGGDFAAASSGGWLGRISELDQVLWRLRGLHRRARMASQVWSGSRSPLDLSGDTVPLAKALRREEAFFRAQASVFAETGLLGVLLRGAVAQGLEEAGIERSDSLAALYCAGTERPWQAEAAEPMLKAARCLQAAPAVIASLSEGEDAVAAALFRHPEVGQHLDGWLEAWNWMSDDPLRLESDRWSDQPLQVLRRLSRWSLRSEEIPLRPPMQAEEDPRLAATRAARCGFLRSVGLRWLAARAARLEEPGQRLRLELHRSFGRMHRLLAAFGKCLERRGALAEASDVHYLVWEECLGWVYGTTPSAWLRETASYRKAEWSVYQSGGYGVTRLEAEAPIHATNPLRGAIYPATDSSKWAGWSVGSPGRVSGPVRVIHSGDAPEALPGEILVGERTSAGWMIALPAASAVVSELGSAASSVSRLGRWMDRPVIVRVPGAAAALRTGDWVEVDGRTGTVSRIAEPKPSSPPAVGVSARNLVGG